MKIFLDKDHKVLINKFLFKNGVACVEDNDYIHPLMNINNLTIARYFRSFVDRGLLTKIFVWQHGYYSLTDEGVEFLRQELCLEDNDLPMTHSMGFIEEVDTEMVKTEE